MEQKVLMAFEAAAGTRAISRLETGEAQTVRPDLLGIEELGFQPKQSGVYSNSLKHGVLGIMTEM